MEGWILLWKLLKFLMKESIVLKLAMMLE
jgi:hypothetical protein